MIKTNDTKVWRADIYLRLSKDDRDKDESNSIKNQREMLLDFVSRNPDICVVNILADDGFTGANFDRAAFKEMISHIEDGSVDCVIVKDFSRLGRDHIETGKYIERYFSTKNVRFIAVNEHYDSLIADANDSSNSLIVPFKNIINEAFLEDISVKTKTQLEIKRKNGELVCNYAVYGYKKQDGKLVVDEYAADIIKIIYDCKIMGCNNSQIASMLNLKGVLSPAEYKKAVGISYNTPFTMNDKAEWSAKAISRILTNRVYLGHLEQGKQTKVSYRMKKFYNKPREEWSIHENAHEPIIDELDFDLVQVLLAMDTKIAHGTPQLHLFSGIAYCGLCGEPMYAKKVTKKSGKAYINYICSTHSKTGGCQYNNISELTLSKLILQIIRQEVDNLLLAEEISSEIAVSGARGHKQAAIEKMIERNLQAIKENNDFLVKSYKHFIANVISETEYQLFKKTFNNQVQTAESNIAALQDELSRLGNDTYATKLIERFLEQKNITELNRRVVVGLIKSIAVNNCKDIAVTFRYDNDYFLPNETDAAYREMEGAVV